LDRIEPSVKALIAHVEDETDYTEPVPVVPEVEEPSHGEDKAGEASHSDEAPAEAEAHGEGE
ncbi:MAG: hypothetical protein RL219_412, partial [Actinomycetota bacterium]